jgi:type IV secretory pathway VirB2 component (pilin)
MKPKQLSLAVFASLLFTGVAHAGTAGALPWEGPLRTIATSLTGPVAFSVALIGIFATGATLVWGGEMNEFARRAALLGLIVAVLVFATNILSSAFGVTGAVI